MDPADKEYLNRMREKLGGYGRLAREAFQRGEYDEAEELERLRHKAIEELLKHFVLEDSDRSRRPPRPN
jgi:hypothetical protein